MVQTDNHLDLSYVTLNKKLTLGKVPAAVEAELKGSHVGSDCPFGIERAIFIFTTCVFNYLLYYKQSNPIFLQTL